MKYCLLKWQCTKRVSDMGHQRGQSNRGEYRDLCEYLVTLISDNNYV